MPTTGRPRLSYCCQSCACRIHLDASCFFVSCASLFKLLPGKVPVLTAAAGHRGELLYLFALPFVCMSRVLCVLRSLCVCVVQCAHLDGSFAAAGALVQELFRFHFELSCAHESRIALCSVRACHHARVQVFLAVC